MILAGAGVRLYHIGPPHVLKAHALSMTLDLDAPTQKKQPKADVHLVEVCSKKPIPRYQVLRLTSGFLG